MCRETIEVQFAGHAALYNVYVMLKPHQYVALWRSQILKLRQQFAPWKIQILKPLQYFANTTCEPYIIKCSGNAVKDKRLVR